MSPLRDRVCLLLIVGALLALAVVADPPFGFGSLSIIASVVSGALIGILVSRYYSRQASEELTREAERLRGYSLITLRVLQALRGGHSFTIRYDDQGEPVGIDYGVTIADQLPVQDRAEPELNPPDKAGG